MPPRSVFILILTLLHLCVKTDAQNNTANSEPRSIVAIRALRASVASVESELQERRQELNAATTAEEKTALSKDIVSLNTRKAGLMTELESVITGIDVETLEEKLGEQVDLGGEVEELLRPIIQELKKATSKPREVEALRAAVAYYTKRRDLAKKAVEHLDSTIKQTNDEEMKAFLDGSRSTWQALL